MFEDADSSLPTNTLERLEVLCAKLSITPSITLHEATFSAAQTQAVLPKGCLVQKTVTDRVAGKLVVWTGVGDFRISRKLHKTANQLLGLPRTSEHTLNPKDVDALQFYGVQPGMVSPFLIPGTPATKELAALFLVDWSGCGPELSVAISLSLHKSLIVPVTSLNELLCLYATETFGRMPLYTVPVSRPA